MSENYWKNKWSTEQIKVMLLEQFQLFWQRDIGIERTQLDQVMQAATLPHAVIISGLRRVGKSTLLAQLAHQLGEAAFYYVNFEDERLLGFQVDDFNLLYAQLLELFGEHKIFLIDEVQNIPRWEQFVRRFIDMGFKFYITGSNASLLSRELGSRLTGRYLPIELFPFSFREFLAFCHYSPPSQPLLTTVERAALQRHLDDYLRRGGIPDPLKYPELPLLRTLYDDVIYRDIAARYQITEVSVLKELAYYLMSNPTAAISFNKLKERFHLGSVNTVKNYVDYLENSWLLFTINVYDYSVKRQQIAPKKVYAIDTGLANAIGFTFSPNRGKLLENLVFLTLRRQSKEIYYVTTPAGYEVDFYLPESRLLLQVCQELNAPDTREREIRAMIDGLRTYNLTHGLILTDQAAEPIVQDGLTIEVHSVAQWLLTQSPNDQSPNS